MPKPLSMIMLLSLTFALPKERVRKKRERGGRKKRGRERRVPLMAVTLP